MGKLVKGDVAKGGYLQINKRNREMKIFLKLIDKKVKGHLRKTIGWIKNDQLYFLLNIPITVNDEGV